MDDMKKWSHTLYSSSRMHYLSYTLWSVVRDHLHWGSIFRKSLCQYQAVRAFLSEIRLIRYTLDKVCTDFLSFFFFFGPDISILTFSKRIIRDIFLHQWSCLMSPAVGLNSHSCIFFICLNSPLINTVMVYDHF